MKIVSANIPDDLKERLENLAQEEDRNISYFVRKFIQEGLDSYLTQKEILKGLKNAVAQSDAAE